MELLRIWSRWSWVQIPVLELQTSEVGQSGRAPFVPSVVTSSRCFKIEAIHSPSFQMPRHEQSPLETYRELTKQLHVLRQEKGEESPEEDTLLDRMDGVWRDLSEPDKKVLAKDVIRAVRCRESKRSAEELYAQMDRMKES